MPSVLQKYHVIPGAIVRVRATIGEQQAGGHAIFLGPVQVGGGELTATADVGPSESVAGKRLVVSSVAVDVQLGHDHVSVGVVLSGGAPDPFPIVQAADATPNGAVSFLTVVDLL